MRTVDFRYQGYFQGLRAYHQLSVKKRAVLVTRMFAGISSQTEDLSVRTRINAFVSKERAKFDAEQNKTG